MSTAFVHEKKDGVAAFKALMRKVASGVHSGNTRTLPTDSNTDFYPVEISRDAIRPGTIFVDPYGHVLVVSKWVPQPAGGYGILMAGTRNRMQRSGDVVSGKALPVRSFNGGCGSRVQGVSTGSIQQEKKHFPGMITRS